MDLNHDGHALPVFTAKGVNFSYNNQEALKGIDLTVRAGERIAILGANGSGKSTTIRMILDILKPDSGAIRVLGGPLTEATKDHVGYLPEERGLYKKMKVLDHLVFLGQLKGNVQGLILGNCAQY